jgi:hypothetical protein
VLADVLATGVQLDKNDLGQVNQPLKLVSHCTQGRNWQDNIRIYLSICKPGAVARRSIISRMISARTLSEEMIRTPKTTSVFHECCYRHSLLNDTIT